jgi:hypothetical protein
VGRTTAYRWLADAAFKEAVEDARRACVEDVEAQHVAAAKGKCVISRIHFLKSHKADVYGDKGKIEVEHHQTPALPQTELPSLAGAMRLLLESAKGLPKPPHEKVIEAQVSTVPPASPSKPTEGEQKH